MKQTIFTLLLLTTVGLISCRKTGSDPNIKQYDDIQIQNYIKANGLTGMKRDSSNGDTSGIYYQIIAQGAPVDTNKIDYPSKVSFVFTIASFDGNYTTTDTLQSNHYSGYLGHITQSNLPNGLQYALRNIVKYKGTRVRLLIPSRLAYGINGYGSGSSSNANTRIAGNQCLDYYVNIVSNQNEYDDYVVANYIKTNNLTGYEKRPSGIYFKQVIAGTGPDLIADETTNIFATYAGKYLNDVAFSTGNTDGTASDITSGGGFSNLTLGAQEGLKGQSVGSSVSIIVPSRLAYGVGGSSAGGIGTNMNARFDFQVTIVTNP